MYKRLWACLALYLQMLWYSSPACINYVIGVYGVHIGDFPKWSRTFIEFSESSELRETDKSLKSMDWAEFKHHVCHVCLTDAVVASWSLTQEVAGLSPFTVMRNIFVTEFSEKI